MNARDPLIHRAPVWRDKANLILQMKVDLTDSQAPEEQIWAKREGDLFQICCIPFFVYDLNLGDTVSMTEQNGRNIVSDVLIASGHHTFRVWFRHNSQAIREDVLQEVETLNCLFEWFDDNLLALSAPDEASALSLVHGLEERESRGQLQFETGRTQQ